MTHGSVSAVVPNWVAVGLAVLSMLGTMYVEYSSNDKTLTSRIAVVEAKQTSDEQNTTDALSHLIDRVDKIYDKVAKW